MTKQTPLLILFFILLATSSFLLETSLVLSSEETISYQTIIDQINLTDIQMSIWKFTEFGSRVTGYNGCEAAADFICQKFIEYGLMNVSFEYYNLTVPLEYYTSINIFSTGKTIRAYTLWPNLIETCALPPEGIEGKLVYVRKGELRNYGERIEGNVVLMDFDSRDNWLYAAQLGAKAVIFIERETTRWDAQLKILDIPLDFPRLYVKEENGNLLLSLLNEGEVYVKIKSFMVYETRKVKNVIGYVLGSDAKLKDETIVISAYYDSYSIVPSLAPGAEEACGIATLLEYAKFFGKPENRPKRTIMFVALSGHNFALAGAREFVYNHFSDVGTRLKLWVNLDLNTITNRVGVFYWSRFYGYNLVTGRYGALKLKILSEYKSIIEKSMGRQYYLEDFMLNTFEAMIQRGLYENEQFYLDNEPFSLAGGLGIGIYTVGAIRLYYGTPFDTFEKLKFENLKPQIELIICILSTLLNDEQISWPDLKPKTSDPGEGGFATLAGRVVEYDRDIAWYKGVSRALVVLRTPSISDIGLTSYSIITQTDNEGYFYIRGVAHIYSYPPGSKLSAFNNFEAYLDDPTFGPIDYAPDYGRYAVFSSTHIPIDLPEKYINIVVFKCGVLSVLGIMNPRGVPLSILNVDVRVFGSDQIPDFYGYIVDARRENLMIFGEPGKRIEAALRSIEVEPFIVLINATEEKLEGNGFELRFNGSTIVNTFQMARDLFCLNEVRLQEIEKWGVPSINAAILHNKTKSYLQTAMNALYCAYPDYEKIISYSVQALSIESIAYAEIKVIMKDVIDATVFFYLLLIPFALLMERLLTSSVKFARRVIFIVSIFLLSAFSFYLLHPGIKMASNIYMILTGFVLTLFILPAIVLLFTKMFAALKEIRKEILGKHFAEISRSSMFLAAISLGVQNMRRRKLRTTLILVSLILIIFSMVAFSSVLNIYIRKPLISSGVTRYRGIFLRETLSTLPAIPKYVTGVIYERTRAYADQIARRIEIKASRPLIFTSQDGKTFQAKSIIGLERSEAEITGIDEAITSGTWLPSGSASNVCIIPEKAAKQLNVNFGDTVVFYGINLTVVGIFNSEIYGSIVDLDQGVITPTIAMALGSRTYSPPAETVIMPYNLALRLSENDVHSIVIKISDPNAIMEVANQVGMVFPGLLVYASVKDGEIISFYSEEQVIFSGWQMSIVPAILCFLIMFNMLLGSIHEREREIGILSSIGLSPRHILGIFIVEPILYAVIGAVLGYVLGTVGNIFLMTFNILPPEYISNIASRWIIMTMGFSMISMLIPALYPAYKAAKLVTPSLERTWKIPTKPRGDEWIIPLPFLVRIEELDGVLKYMKEYFQSHLTERAGVFWIRDLQYQEEESEGTLIKSLNMIVRLAPYEAGLEQETKLIFLIEKENPHANVEIQLKRMSGILQVWKNANRSYIDAVRKQLLLWTSLKEIDKEKYLKT